MKRVFILYFFFITKLYAQQTETETFGTVPAGVASTIADHEAANKFVGVGLTYSGSALVSSNDPSPFGGANVFFDKIQGKELIIDGYKPNSACTIDVSFWIYKYVEAVTGTEFYVEYSTTGPSGPWIFGPQFNPLPNGPGTVRYHKRSLQVPNNFTSIRFYQAGTLSQYRIDQLVITGTGVGCTFPVKLNTFFGEKFQNDVSLTWSTASETNFSHFVVQKSKDAKGFENIGRIESAGFESEKNEYSFKDEKPFSGNNYYRLKMVDKDGTEDYSKMISVNFDRKALAVFYPNPTQDFVRFENIKTEDISSVVVHKINGEFLGEIHPTTDGIDISGFKSRELILQLKMKNNQTITSRIIKQD
ncbi:MAG: T9SS type A sorting domain-containing protein [Cytophagaceae bacterium]|nr:T9SS type A sorting domain-containing protein [Cytophagaceae bacterium]